MNAHASHLDGPALELLVAEALKHLEDLSYSPVHLGRFRGTWRGFLNWFAAADKSGSIVDLAGAYLASRGIAQVGPSLHIGAHQRHIRRAMEALGEYAMHGYIRRRRQMASRAPLPADLAMRLAEAERFWEGQISGSTLRSRRRALTGFLGFVASRGITIVGDIDPPVLSDFVAFRCHLLPQSLAKELSDVRAFLRYLAERRLIGSELVAALPRVRVRRQGRIPSVWPDQDVTALLAAVDRGSPVGKRDYAILLLAARLGLRASDIKGLGLDHLLWAEARIEFNQSKTAIPLSLPLSEEIGSALIDHLRHGRPPSRYREVFLKVNAPIEPFGKDSGLYYIITKYGMCQ